MLVGDMKGEGVDPPPTPTPTPNDQKKKLPPKWTWAQTRTEDVGPANDGMGVLPPLENDTRSLACEYIMTLYLALGWDRQKKKKTRGCVTLSGLIVGHVAK